MKTLLTIVQSLFYLNSLKYLKKCSVEKCYYLLIEIIFYIKINMVSLQRIQQYMHIYIMITFWHLISK